MPELAVSLAQRADGCAAHTEIEVRRATATGEVLTAHERQLREIALTAHAREVTALTTDRDRWRAEAERRVEPASWFETPVVVAIISVTATVLSLYVFAQVVRSVESSP